MQINAALWTPATPQCLDSFDHCHKHNFLIDLVINHKLYAASWLLYETPTKPAGQTKPASEQMYFIKVTGFISLTFRASLLLLLYLYSLAQRPRRHAA